jgi:hypothetical protein
VHYKALISFCKVRYFYHFIRSMQNTE